MTNEVKTNKRFPISPARRKRLEAQGYEGYTDYELNDFKFGIRFAYYLCVTIVIIGLLLTSQKILAAAMAVAFLGTFPPYHPFDYLYNNVIRHLIEKPKIPHRSAQGRFACGIASAWLGGIIFLFYHGLYFWGYLAGVILVSIALLVSTMDICIPSIIYNFLFKRRTRTVLKNDF